MGFSLPYLPLGEVFIGPGIPPKEGPLLSGFIYLCLYFLQEEMGFETYS